MASSLKAALAGLAAALVLGAAAVAAADDDTARRVEQSRAVVADFAKTLKGELTRAMSEGGPTAAIGVCQQVAPAIAADASQRTGWTVGRTSLRVRNPANAPDAWEQETLRGFEARKAAGEKPSELETYGFVEQDGRKVFRYMKAIPTGKLCLACHGSELDPAVRAALAEAYPGDRATGFALGDIRGAFTITQPR
ncbi:Protein of unknown function [Tistlia consotensis]|uniref:Tll0287-like domain-containing protein n=1 Tax=Tistlia consotensis USBA 355 TaxID=560819 RepID=A0A1Y6C630_9PROT|nr:DUF3365 domain-containing protein [Tistlia consotensis]SMF43842.1 Protein of unknown function [Tistlia consotensis USBA 355]SNR42942.1 Protein of unknown function [Tistlia consotensis]